MVSDKKRANAVEGKMPRACDVCIRKRARLYCASDDAFLCQACDASVHSANPLARRHERVRLKMASSFKRSEEDENQENCVPTWHHGFTKKARTPRHGKHYNSKRKSSEDQPMLDLPHPVPEICSDEASQEDNENQLLYWVPVFDPFVAAPCTVLNPNEERMAIFDGEAERSDTVARNESKNALWHDVNSLHGFLPSEMDLAEFAANVQTMLGKGLEVESFDMERLGLLDCKEEKLQEGCFGSGRMKVEEEAAAASIADQVNTEIDVSKEPFELNLDDYDSSITREGDEKIEQMDMIAKKDEEFKEYVIKGKKNSLRLNYEGVLTAWDDQRSPWTTGERPEVDLNENDWPYFMGTCGSGTVHQPYVEMGIIGGGQTIMMEWGREARVLRYREKRRTRLFSKKIRYEVRKLNAEKRPRMKGRFVKRANFAAPAAFPLLNK